MQHNKVLQTLIKTHLQSQYLTALILVMIGKCNMKSRLDVYDNEPNPSIHLCMHNAISLTPHIGAATLEAQERIGAELANQIIKHFN